VVFTSLFRGFCA
jgi:D-tyrosyl-tRNA(Tyr) deacylase